MTSRLPAVFVSHGSPTLIIDNDETTRFLGRYGRDLPRPDAILVASAHWETEVPTVSAVARPETIHDFGGFARELYEMQYPAPGAPWLAERVTEVLGNAGIDCRTSPSRGLDHGAWVPLKLIYPEADIPVTQLSIQPQRDPAWHFALGEALRPLRDEGVLVMGSGSLTHNLRAVFTGGMRHDAPVPDWVMRFADWVDEAVSEGRIDDLLAYRTMAPFAAENHPTDEHLLPLFVALGAGHAGEAHRRVHSSHAFGALAMDAFQIG